MYCCIHLFPTAETMVQQTRRVVEDYVLYKIRTTFTNSPDLVPLPEQKPSELNIAVRKIAEEYERRYKQNFPDLFEEIQSSRVSTRDVNLVLSKISKDLFQLPMKKLVNGKRETTVITNEKLSTTNVFVHEQCMYDDAHIKWGHIIAFLVFAGILAVRAVELDFAEEVDEIVRWVSTFFDSELAGWLRKQGGWNSLAEWTRATNGTLIYDNDFDSSLSSGVRSVMSVGVLAACLSLGAIMIARK